jgi:CRP-like cAMP-binding protein
MGESGKKSYQKGAFIYIESDEETDEVFIVETGEVELTGDPGMPRFRPVLKPGDIFGFTSCLSRRPRMESAVARTACTCAVLDRERFLESVHANPELAGRIISYFAQELRAYNRMVASDTEEPENTDEHARLFDLAAHFQATGHEAHAVYALEVYGKRFPKGARAAEAAKIAASLRAKGAAPIAPVQRGLCRAYADHQVIFCEHEPGDELFIVKSGKVEILKVSPPEEILLSILREGDIFGELSIVASAPRSATAVSVGEALLLPVSRESLSAVFARSPGTVTKILAALSQRIWFTFIRLRSKVYENPITRVYVLLENKLLEERVSLASTKPTTLPIGIGEILGMAGVAHDQLNGVKDALIQDTNFAFQFKKVTIESPSALEAKARYFKTRDHIDSPEPRKKPDGERKIGLDVHELRVAPDTIPEG